MSGNKRKHGDIDDDKKSAFSFPLFSTTSLIFGYAGLSASRIIECLEQVYDIRFPGKREATTTTTTTEVTDNTVSEERPDEKNETKAVKRDNLRYSDGGFNVKNDETIEEMEERLGDLLCSLLQTSSARVYLFKGYKSWSSSLKDTIEDKPCPASCYVALQSLGSVTNKMESATDDSSFENYKYETINSLPSIVNSRGDRADMIRIHERLFSALKEEMEKGEEINLLSQASSATTVSPPNYHLINFYNKK
jgi:hypothetical protein